MLPSARHPAISGGLAWLRRVRRQRSVVLGYHGIDACPLTKDLSRLQFNPTTFERHVTLLVKAGFEFRTVRDAIDDLADTPRPGIAVISFDDGLRNNYTTALPILRALGVTATVYVTCDFIGGHSPWIEPGGGGEMLSESEIRALAAEGWEIGAHTLSHPDMSSLDLEACRAEIEGSRRALEALIDAPVDTFAYPFGSYGPAAIEAVRSCGMRAALTTGSGRWDRFELTRAMPSNGDTAPIVALKLVDRYEPLLRLPALRTLRQASRRVRKPRVL